MSEAFRTHFLRGATRTCVVKSLLSFSNRVSTLRKRSTGEEKEEKVKEKARAPGNPVVGCASDGSSVRASSDVTGGARRTNADIPRRTKNSATRPPTHCVACGDARTELLVSISRTIVQNFAGGRDIQVEKLLVFSDESTQRAQYRRGLPTVRVKFRKSAERSVGSSSSPGVATANVASGGPRRQRELLKKHMQEGHFYTEGLLWCPECASSKGNSRGTISSGRAGRCRVGPWRDSLRGRTGSKRIC